MPQLNLSRCQSVVHKKLVDGICYVFIGMALTLLAKLATKALQAASIRSTSQNVQAATRTHSTQSSDLVPRLPENPPKRYATRCMTYTIHLRRLNEPHTVRPATALSNTITHDQGPSLHAPRVGGESPIWLPHETFASHQQAPSEHISP